MATDEEYLDNLLKSLTGGDEPEDGQNDTGDMDVNDNLMSDETEEQPKADGLAETEEQPKADGLAETEEQPKTDGLAETEEQLKTDGLPETEEQPKTDGLPEAEEQPKTDGLPEAEEQPKTDGLAETEEQPKTDGLPEAEELPKTEDLTKAEAGAETKPEEQPQDKEQIKIDEQSDTFNGFDGGFQPDMEGAEGESFLDSLDMELDNVDDWENDINTLLAQNGDIGAETQNSAGTANLDTDSADAEKLQSVMGEGGNIDDPDLLQMFENLENADSDLDEINSLLNKANMNEDVDDDMFALLESAEENQNYDDSEEAFDIFAEGEMEEFSGANMSRANAGSENESDDNKKKKKKKPGFLAKLFAILTKEDDEPEEKGKTDKPGKEEAVSDANAKLLQELSGGGGKKAAAKEKKKTPEKDKKKKAKPAAKPKPKKPKKIKEKTPAAVEKPVKILNKKGLIAIIALCATIIAGVLILSTFIPQFVSRQEARTAFNNGDYETTYELFYKKKLSKKETELYNKSKTVLRMERKLQSYENNMAMDRELEAVDALFLGVKCYEGLREADTYGVRQEVDAVYQQICGILENNYGISEEEAISITKFDNVRYTKKIKALVGELAVPEDTDSISQESESGAADGEDGLPETGDTEGASELQDVLPEEEDILE